MRQPSDDEKYYDKHNNRAIPRFKLKRLVVDVLKSKGKFRVEKKAIDILHSEVEKYAAEIFMVSDLIMKVSDRHTINTHFFKNSVKLLDLVVQNRLG